MVAMGPLVTLALLAVAASAQEPERSLQPSPPLDGATAVDAAADPDARVQEALAAFDALELERAAALLEPLVTDPDLRDDVRARAWLALGLTRASLLDMDGARVAFAAALAIDRHLSLPSGTSPKVAALFEDTRASLLPDEPTRTDAAQAAAAPPVVPPTGTTAAASTGGSAPSSPAPARAQDAVDAAAAVEQADGRWPFLVGGGALLGAAALAAGGALVADRWLDAAAPGRTREEYEAVRGVGVAALVSSAALLVGGGFALALPLLLEDPA